MKNIKIIIGIVAVIVVVFLLAKNFREGFTRSHLNDAHDADNRANKTKNRG